MPAIVILAVSGTEIFEESWFVNPAGCKSANSDRFFNESVNFGVGEVTTSPVALLTFALIFKVTFFPIAAVSLSLKIKSLTEKSAILMLALFPLSFVPGGSAIVPASANESLSGFVKLNFTAPFAGDA